MDTNQEPPKTVKEVGIHLIYLSKDVSDIKKQLSEMSGHFVTKQELIDAIQTRRIEQKQICDHVQGVDDRLSDVEKVIDAIKNRIVIVAVSMLALMILAQYGLQEFFKG